MAVWPLPGLSDTLARLTGATGIARSERVQALWSGYGEIRRLELVGGRYPTVIVKAVMPPSTAHHPRGWSSDRSHARKLRSYAVETAFYGGAARHCGDACRVPRCLATEERDGRFLLVLEDLDAAGFDGRRDQLDDAELDHCLAWLAAFHSTFLGTFLDPSSSAALDGLWPMGTYWHLATRPDELAALPESEPLRRAARTLDARLQRARHRTLVHGDAKVANFCFGQGGVAAVDFQYVGGGCGMQDVAYFFSSCLSDAQCEARAPALLDRYFGHLSREVSRRGTAVDMDALEAEWRDLYPVAWADFHRFLAGWAPGHWKIHRYTRAQTELALRGAEQG